MKGTLIFYALPFSRAWGRMVRYAIILSCKNERDFHDDVYELSEEWGLIKALCYVGSEGTAARATLDYIINIHTHTNTSIFV